MEKLTLDALGRMSEEEYMEAKKIPIIMVLDNIRSLHNVGSVFRTSDAYRLEAIYLCGITPCPPQKEIHKTALGAEKTVEWKYFKTTAEAVSELKKNEYTVVSVEQTTDSLEPDEIKKHEIKKLALIMGHEVYGVEEEIINISDFTLELPQFGTKHSLNISVCAGIVIWEMQKLFSRD